MALIKPPYEWTCQRCHGDNAAHTDLCATCGMTASFTAAQLAEFNTEQMRPVGAGLPEIAFIAAIALLALIGSQFPGHWPLWLDPRLILLGIGVIFCVLALVWAGLKKAWKRIRAVTSRR